MDKKQTKTFEKGAEDNRLSLSMGNPKKPKILIVDDEDTIREYLKQLLELNGFEVLEAWYRQQAIDIAREHKPFFSLIDIDLGRGESGFEICRELRGMAETSQMKIAMLTAMSRNDYEPSSYNCHADVFFTKSDGVSGLIAYAKARAQENPEKAFSSQNAAPQKSDNRPIDRTQRVEKCGIFIDPFQNQVWYRDQLILDLAPIELKILVCMLKHSPAIVSRETILNEVWIDSTVESNTVDVHIFRMRKKLPSSLAKKIHSQSGKGYQITE